MNKRITTMGRLVWNEATGEGEIRLAQDFHAAYRVLQMDALVDWKFDINALYERMLLDGGVLGPLKSSEGESIQ